MHRCIFMNGHEKTSKCLDYDPKLNKPRSLASAHALKKLMVMSITTEKKEEKGRDQDTYSAGSSCGPRTIYNFLRTTCVVER